MFVCKNHFFFLMLIVFKMMRVSRKMNHLPDYDLVHLIIYYFNNKCSHDYNMNLVIRT